MRSFFTVTRKVACGYLVIILFALLAVGYALISLHHHHQRTTQLVGGQFLAYSLLRDIRQNLLSQENLEKQLLILRDLQFLDLLEGRADELDVILKKLRTAALPDYFSALPQDVMEYAEQSAQLRQTIRATNWPEAERMAAENTSRDRRQLLESLAGLNNKHQETLDRELKALSEQSDHAYQLTLLITLIGILLSAPVALTVIASIHRSVKALQQATHDIAGGSFESPINIRGSDEFGQLARDFVSMAHKLRELESRNLDANPLTRLPGNLVIDRRIEWLIERNVPFAHLYIDLDNFKAYGDHYGYKLGSNAIHLVGNLLREVTERQGNADDLVGHIGGDDYVILTTPELAEPLAQKIIEEFDLLVPGLYEPQDLKAGFIQGVDRYGVRRDFPLLTMSIAITLSENLEHPSLLTISHNCARMKKHLKKTNKSNYLIDRRKQLP
jgi:GGDEF domain-containing protein